MQFLRWSALLMAVVLITSCFYPWVSIESKNIVISGFSSDVADYGKPGIMHLFISSICVLFLLINRPWSIRAAFFVSVLNIAWALRNFFLISACRGGICPVKHPALYIVLISSLLFSILIVLIRPQPKNREAKLEE